jgi:hypothetical protein
MKKLMIAIFISALLLTKSYADGWSLGEMADWAMGPVNGLGKIFGYICLIGGIGMILGAFLQYQAHRENPSQIRLSTPVFLLVVGLILLILPFVGMLVGYKDALIQYY